MQVTLSMLWIPILVSAVFVFIAANLLWMALPFWHRSDYKKLPDEKAVLAGLTSAASGQYMAPNLDWSKATAEEKEAFQKGPMALLLVRNPNAFSLGKSLTLYFLYSVVVSVLVAYVCGVTLAPHTHYLRVFRVAGTAAILAYAFRGVPDSVWYGKPWVVTFKELIDGVIYGLLTAGTFGWLWPH
jgi:hypothetical protein